jgi:HD superfamily phosphohydrolase YqeK
MDIDALEDYCKHIYEQAPSLIHRWGHIERTTLGAKWFVRILGGSKEEEELAHIAGILHDIVRPNTEKVDHAQASADEAERILRKFEFEEEKIPLIVQAVRDHRKKPEKWASALHQSIFLSDKLLEQMGPYIVFRRLVYTGELKDYSELDAEEAIIASWKRALKYPTPKGVGF